MGWDATRPVPWQRLVREWLLYVGIMAVIFVVVFRDTSLLGLLGGLLASGPLYLLFGYVLAKFGYQRKSWKELRAEAKERPARSKAADTADSADRRRAKPAPTSRTGGPSTRPNSKKKRRR